MDKKIIVIISLIVIILLYGFYVCFGTGLDSTVKVGSTEFILPEGYYEGSPNELGAVNITNGNSSIFIYEYDGNDTQRYISHYTDSQNYNISIINYTFDDVIIYRTDNKDSPDKIHSWFIKNNKTYDVYTWDGNKDIEGIVMSFVKS